MVIDRCYRDDQEAVLQVLDSSALPAASDHGHPRALHIQARLHGAAALFRFHLPGLSAVAVFGVMVLEAFGRASAGKPHMVC